MSDPAKDQGEYLDRLERQMREDQARAQTDAAFRQYTENADGGHYRPDDPVKDNHLRP